MLGQQTMWSDCAKNLISVSNRMPEGYSIYGCAHECYDYSIIWFSQQAESND